MKRLILIKGTGGAGKHTNSELLHFKLPKSAWVHMRWLLRERLWNPTDSRCEDLGNRNAAAVINNYFDVNIERMIYSGNVNNQRSLEYLLSRVIHDCQVNYFWLDVDRDVRYNRLLNRARDDGDKPEFLNKLFNCPGIPRSAPAIIVENGTYHRIDTTTKSPEEVVEEMLGFLT
jgi:hypothetical protein